MNWDRIEGRWKQFAGNARHHWGRIANSRSDVIAGERIHLDGTAQRMYGAARDEADRQLSAWRNPRKAQSVRAGKSNLFPE